jgi:hypothetical protein
MPVVDPIFSSVGTGPYSVAFDNNRNMYVANKGDGTITKINVLSGVKVDPFASIANLGDIVCDSNGNIFAVYEGGVGNRGIAKITPAGVVTANWCPLDLPEGGLPAVTIMLLAIDSANNLYICSNHLVLTKITSAAVVSYVWATLEYDPVGTNFIYQIIVDSSNNIYAKQAMPGGADRITKVTSAGTVTEGWVSAIGTGTGDMVLDSGNNIFVSATNAGVAEVTKITPAGVVTLPWTVNTSGATSAKLALDKISGNVYATTLTYLELNKITAAGTLTQGWLNAEGSNHLEMANPSKLVVDPSFGKLFIFANSKNIHRVGLQIQEMSAL